MPTAPPRPCNLYGCPKVAARDGYCEDHWKPRWTRYKSGSKIHDKGIWKKVRKAFLRRHPLCEDCCAAATVAHHIIPVDDGGEPFNSDNLKALCRDCHEVEHGRKSV